MKIMSVEQAQEIAQEFLKCKTLDEQKAFVAEHQLELEFKDKEEKTDGENNKGSTKSTK